MKTQEIIQINATVIAGVLILLTITFSTHLNSSLLEKVLSVLSWAIILPFGFSSIRALQVELDRLHGKKIDEIHNSDLISSLTSMQWGFVYVIIVIGLYVALLYVL